MRKSIVRQEKGKAEDGRWLDLAQLAQVEISSEDPAHPIETALQPGGGAGWRAAEPGRQVIRLLFDQPQRIRRIHLQIDEKEHPRTQEFVLRWSQDQGGYREIVRQQYNFSPGAPTEREEYNVDLSGVSALELEINPDIGGAPAKASLSMLRVG